MNLKTIIMKTKNQKLKNSRFFLTTLLLFTVNVMLFAQNDSIPNSVNNFYKDPVGDYFKKVSFRIGGGVLIPQNGLKEYFVFRQ